MITTSRTRGESVVWAFSPAWNSENFAATSGCRRKVLYGPISRPSAVVIWIPALLLNGSHVAFSASNRSRCAPVSLAGSASGSRPPRVWLGLVIVAAPCLGCAGCCCRPSGATVVWLWDETRRVGRDVVGSQCQRHAGEPTQQDGHIDDALVAQQLPRPLVKSLRHHARADQR